MHVQVVTYKIPETTDAEFVAANQEFASLMAAVPRLLAKIWLKAPDGNVGGVYFWRDREAYEDFTGSELWASVLEDDSLSDLESRNYATMGELSRLTQPGLAWRTRSGKMA